MLLNLWKTGKTGKNMIQDLLKKTGEMNPSVKEMLKSSLNTEDELEKMMILLQCSRN